MRGLMNCVYTQKYKRKMKARRDGRHARSEQQPGAAATTPPPSSQLRVRLSLPSSLVRLGEDRDLRRRRARHQARVRPGRLVKGDAAQRRLRLLLDLRLLRVAARPAAARPRACRRCSCFWCGVFVLGGARERQGKSGRPPALKPPPQFKRSPKIIITKQPTTTHPPRSPP